MAARYEFARPQTNVDVLLFTVPDFWRAIVAIAEGLVERERVRFSQVARVR